MPMRLSNNALQARERKLVLDEKAVQDAGVPANREVQRPGAPPRFAHAPVRR